jgi:hypothetical protein
MTFYHGRDNTPFVYTGVEPWDWTREDCQGLVDFVLGDVWKLTKAAPASNVVLPGAPSRVSRPITPRTAVRLDPHRMRP